MSIFNQTYDIVRQMEYYFGQANIQTDVHLQNMMDTEGWVALAEVCAWPRMVRLGVTDPMEVAKALANYSSVVEVDCTGEKVRSRQAAPQFAPAFTAQAYPMMHPQMVHPQMFHPHSMVPHANQPEQVGQMFLHQVPVPPHHFVMSAYPVYPHYNQQTYYLPDGQPQVARMYGPPVPVFPEQMGMESLPHPMQHSAQQAMQQPQQWPAPLVEECNVGEQGQSQPGAINSQHAMDDHMGDGGRKGQNSAAAENGSNSLSAIEMPTDGNVHPEEPAPMETTGCGAVQFGAIYAPQVPVFTGNMGSMQQPKQSFSLAVPHPMAQSVPYGARDMGGQFSHHVPFAGEQTFGAHMQSQIAVPALSQVSSNVSESADCWEDFQVPKPKALRSGCQARYQKLQEIPLEKLASEVSFEDNDITSPRYRKTGPGYGPSSPSRRTKKDYRRRYGDGNEEPGREVRLGHGYRKPYTRYPRDNGKDAVNGGRRKHFHRQFNKGTFGVSGTQRFRDKRAEVLKEKPDLQAANFPPLPLAKVAEAEARGQESKAGAWVNKPASVLTSSPTNQSRTRQRRLEGLRQP